MIEKRLNELDDFYGINGVNEEKILQKVIIPLSKDVNKITIGFNSLQKMYEFEKEFVEKLDDLHHKYSSEDICPPTRTYLRTADERNLVYTIRRLK